MNTPLKKQAYDDLGRPLYMHHEVSDKPLFPHKTLHPDNILTIDDKVSLTQLYDKWLAARSIKDYEAADTLRNLLTQSGCVPPEYSRWSPYKESDEQREIRLNKRKITKRNP